MGVYIKGMKMPKSCRECHFCFVGTWCCFAEREDILFDATPEWCPLTEVPEPHGGLIDADALLGSMTKAMESGSNLNGTFHLHIEHAPTIMCHSTEAVQGERIKATGMMPPEFHGHHCCSECGNFANMEPPFGNREDLSKFCPNCGARMHKGGADMKSEVI